MENGNLYFLLLLLLIIPLIFLASYCCRRKPAPKLQKVEYLPAAAPKIEYFVPEPPKITKCVQVPSLYPVYIPDDFQSLPNEGISGFQFVDINQLPAGFNEFDTLDSRNHGKPVSIDGTCYTGTMADPNIFVIRQSSVVSDFALDSWMPHPK